MESIILFTLIFVIQLLLVLRIIQLSKDIKELERDYTDCLKLIDTLLGTNNKRGETIKKIINTIEELSKIVDKLVREKD